MRQEHEAHDGHDGPDGHDGRAPRLGALLRASRADAFDPGFADRVMRRLASEGAAAGADAMADLLAHWFARLAPLAAAAAVLLAVANVARAGDERRTLVDAALGLPAVTLEGAYASALAGEGGR